ncbi:MAG: hypothetical protein GY938_24425 [Ketobacter sp.]|nr:hypothetical protein [Ketobacter sp.]
MRIKGNFARLNSKDIEDAITMYVNYTYGFKNMVVRWLGDEPGPDWVVTVENETIEKKAV